jgi:hypothetical protein
MTKLGILLVVGLVLGVLGGATGENIRVTLMEPTIAKAGGYAILKDPDGGEVGYVFSSKNDVLFKPYVRSLLSPGGVNPLRDNVPDHIHHHGLMFAVAIDGVDFWSETKTCGRQVQRDISKGGTCNVSLADGAVFLPGIEVRIDWTRPDGNTVVATEKRTIQLRGGTNPMVVSWRTQLAPPAGTKSIRLTGSHYFGLGMRFVKSMDNASTFIFADPAAKGLKVRSDEKLTPSAWAACTGKVDGKTVTVAMFDHPDNTRPALWFTMGKPFSYLSATINLWKEPMVIKAGEELDVCYGIAVWDGKATREQIDAAWGRWKKLAPLLKPTAKGKPQGKDNPQ